MTDSEYATELPMHTSVLDGFKNSAAASTDLLEHPESAYIHTAEAEELTSPDIRSITQAHDITQVNGKRLSADSEVLPAEALDHEDDEDDDDQMIFRPKSRGKKSMIARDDDEALNHPIRQADKSLVAADDEEDEEGNSKVDRDGALLGDRTYICRAFRLPMRGETYFFLATEIARVSGYRDSYLLFNKNRSLRKLMTTEAEKAFLIANELIPYSYRNRPIGIVDSRSIYKIFGAKVIHRGRRVRDDYFSQRARDQGYSEEDFANEDDRPNDSRSMPQTDAQRRAEVEADFVVASNAMSATDFNSALNTQRKKREVARRMHFRTLNKV